MREPSRPARPLTRPVTRPITRPVARLLIVALGLLGFVVGPAGAGTPGAASPTGAVVGGTVQQAPARTRGPDRDRTRPARARLSAAAQTWAAVATAQPAHPSNAAHAPSAALPAPDAWPSPPSRRVVRAVAGPAAPEFPPAGVPRGRAPPSSPRI
jgi:hypothetical protein